MAESELEVRIDKKITKLQAQINSLNVQLQRVLGQITHPSILGRIRAEHSANLGDLLGTTNQVVVTNGTDAIYKKENVTLALPQNIHSGASPTFAGLTLGALAGMVKATAGVLSAITTSADLLAVVSDETGSGLLVFNDSPTLKTPSITDLPVYPNNADALTGGLVAGNLYRTGGTTDTICVVH